MRKQPDQPYYYPEEPPARKPPDRPTSSYYTEPRPAKRRTEQPASDSYYGESIPTRPPPDPAGCYYVYNEVYYNEEIVASNTSVASDVSPAPAPAPASGCQSKTCSAKLAAKSRNQSRYSKTEVPVVDLEDSDYEGEDPAAPICGPDACNEDVPKKLPSKHDTITLTTVAVEQKTTQTSLHKMTNGSTQTTILGSQLDAQLKKDQKEESKSPKGCRPAGCHKEKKTNDEPPEQPVRFNFSHIIK